MNEQQGAAAPGALLSRPTQAPQPAPPEPTKNVVPRDPGPPPVLLPASDGNPGPTNTSHGTQSARDQAPISPVAAGPLPTQPPPPPSFWDECLAFFRRPEVIAIGVVALTAGVAIALSKRDEALSDADLDPPWPPPPLPERFARYRPRSAAEQLAVNREEGSLFEELVGETLTDAFPDAAVLSQLSVITPDGKGRRLDFAIKNRNGSVTPVEVKNVPELLEKHVQQAEDHRAGLRHSHGVRSGLPIVVVRENTVVSDDLARRVRLVRHPT
jgi:hypothetical protein